MELLAGKLTQLWKDPAFLVGKFTPQIRRSYHSYVNDQRVNPMKSYKIP